MKILKPLNICILITLIFFSCQEVYIPDNLDNDQQIPVIEAKMIEGEKCEVKLSWASGYNTYKNLPIEGAEVTISDDLGNQSILNEEYPGEYKGDENSLTGTCGRKYSIRIVTNDNSVYESEAELMEECPPIDSLYAEIDSKDFVTYNYYKEMVVKKLDGLNVFLDTRFKSEDTKYFKFDTRIITQWYHQTNLDAPFPTSVYCFEVSDALTQANIFASINKDGYQIVPRRKIDFVDYRFNTKPENEGETPKSLQGWIFTVSAYCISKTAYNYYNAINTQINAEEKIFDPIPSQITGNIKCTSDASKEVLGLFEVASTVKKNTAFYWATGMTYYKRNADFYVPDLVESDCQEGERPDFWVQF